MSPWQSIKNLFTSGYSGKSVTSSDAMSQSIGSERGARPTPENQLRYLYDQLTVTTELRSTILAIRSLDKLDGRVKKIHGRMARDLTKGGLKIYWRGKENKQITKLFEQLSTYCLWKSRGKLESDAKGLIKEGNLAVQIAVDTQLNINKAVRMPSETIYPNVTPSGIFKSVHEAYYQKDMMSHEVQATFPLWKLVLTRLDPENFDDLGSMGRPLLDACRETLLKLRMTETDLVVRRRQRAPLRFSHVLEGATKDELAVYRAENEAEQGDITTDFYSNKKGGVTAVQGDGNIGEINDVVHLLDTFYSGAPAPKGLFGYTEGLARDVLEDLKKDYFEELDAIQDMLANTYYEIFCLQLLLKGYNPEAYDFQVVFNERQTMTLNQRADLALKYQAMGIPNSLVWHTAGLDPIQVENKRDEEKDSTDPYPKVPGKKPTKVSITPGNAPKGESATSISE